MTQSSKRRPTGANAGKAQQRHDGPMAQSDLDAHARNVGGNDKHAMGDAGEGPATSGTLSSGYSSRSSTGGTAGGVLNQRGSGYSPGADSTRGAKDNESGTLAREGVAAGASGMGPASPDEDPEGNETHANDDTGAIGGVAGVSGGGNPTTSGAGKRR
jgi:hypothetical protein